MKVSKKDWGDKIPSFDSIEGDPPETPKDPKEKEILRQSIEKMLKRLRQKLADTNPQ